MTNPRKIGDDRHPKARSPYSRWSEPGVLDACKGYYLTEGLSAAQTARRLGPGFTRNMVVGVAFREGWKRSPEVSRQNIRRNAVAVGAQTTRAKPPPKPKSGATQPPRVLIDQKALVQPLDVSQARPWTQRKLGQCAWPIEINGETYSCCAPVGHDSPSWAYCPQHKARLHKPAAPGKPKLTASELIRSCRRYA